jgi:uncharacterized membrane protein YvbJ
MFCSECGEKLTEKDKFCTKCGKEFNPTKSFMKSKKGKIIIGSMLVGLIIIGISFVSDNSDLSFIGVVITFVGLFVSIFVEEKIRGV